MLNIVFVLIKCKRYALKHPDHYTKPEISDLCNVAMQICYFCLVYYIFTIQTTPPEMLIELSPEEFIGTMSAEMEDVTETADPVVDISPYVEALIAAGLILPNTLEEELIEIIYRNEEQTYDHVLLPTDHEEIFIAIVIDLDGEQILGHYRMDLNDEPGSE
jgi:hypothetical protein